MFFFFFSLGITGLTQGVLRERKPWWTPPNSEFLRAGAVFHHLWNITAPSCINCCFSFLTSWKPKHSPKVCGEGMRSFDFKDSKPLVTRQVGADALSQGARGCLEGCDPRATKLGSPVPPSWTPSFPRRRFPLLFLSCTWLHTLPMGDLGTRLSLRGVWGRWQQGLGQASLGSSCPSHRSHLWAAVASWLLSAGARSPDTSLLSTPQKPGRADPQLLPLPLLFPAPTYGCLSEDKTAVTSVELIATGSSEKSHDIY